MIIAAPKGDEEDDIPPPNVLKHLRDRGPFLTSTFLIILDSRIQLLESELKRINDQIYRLKEDLIPVFKIARDKVQTLKGSKVLLLTRAIAPPYTRSSNSPSLNGPLNNTNIHNNRLKSGPKILYKKALSPQTKRK